MAVSVSADGYAYTFRESGSGSGSGNDDNEAATMAIANTVVHYGIASLVTFGVIFGLFNTLVIAWRQSTSFETLLTGLNVNGTLLLICGAIVQLPNYFGDPHYKAALARRRDTAYQPATAAKNRIGLPFDLHDLENAPIYAYRYVVKGEVGGDDDELGQLSSWLQEIYRYAFALNEAFFYGTLWTIILLSLERVFKVSSSRRASASSININSSTDEAFCSRSQAVLFVFAVQLVAFASALPKYFQFIVVEKSEPLAPGPPLNRTTVVTRYLARAEWTTALTSGLLFQWYTMAVAVLLPVPLLCGVLLLLLVCRAHLHKQLKASVADASCVAMQSHHSLSHSHSPRTIGMSLNGDLGVHIREGDVTTLIGNKHVEHDRMLLPAVVSPHTPRALRQLRAAYLGELANVRLCIALVSAFILLCLPLVLYRFLRAVQLVPTCSTCSLFGVQQTKVQSASASASALCEQCTFTFESLLRVLFYLFFTAEFVFYCSLFDRYRIAILTIIKGKQAAIENEHD